MCAVALAPPRLSQTTTPNAATALPRGRSNERS